MTAMQGFVEAERNRQELLGVHSLDHFCLTVPDAADAQSFFGASGLEIADGGNHLALRTEANGHTWARLSEGRRKQVSYLSFGAYEEDLPRFRDHLKQLEIETIKPPDGVESDGIWFLDHDGRPVEIRVAPKTSPSAKQGAAPMDARDSLRAAPFRGERKIRPLRLAHMVLFTRDVDHAIQFYSRTLGLRLSDRSGGVIAFLHGIHGSDHHIVAFVHSDGPGLHHTSWDVGGIDQIGLAAMQMAGRGYCEGWGLGRHQLGSNYFHYVRDPWKSYIEYTCDADFIPKGCAWPAADHPIEEAFYVWGPQPPADFAANHELAG